MGPATDGPLLFRHFKKSLSRSLAWAGDHLSSSRERIYESVEQFQNLHLETGPGFFVNLNDSISSIRNLTTVAPGDILNNTSLEVDPEFEGYVPYHQRPETYIVPVLFAIIFIIGVLGNGTLILIFLKHRTMRNVPNMYICSLAVGDILVIFFCVPFTSTVYTVDSWPYGLLVCKFSEFIRDVSIGVSVFTLTALSADRYFAIVDPMRKLAGRRATRVTCLTIAGIWIVSIVISLPSVMFSYIKVYDQDSDHTFLVCYPFPDEFGPMYPKIMVVFKALVYYVVPLGFIASFYIVMAHHLVLSTRNMPGEAQGQGRQIQARKKVAKMVLSFVVIFAMCFFLSHVFPLWFWFDPNSEENFNTFWHVVRIVGFCAGFLNSCINPITLYCVSGTFRKHFNQQLFCCFFASRRNSRTGVKTTTCCPNISTNGRGRRAGQHSFRNTSYNSEGGGTLNGRLNGHRRASTLTSTTSVRTKVTWDINKSPTPSQRQHLLTVNNRSGSKPHSSPTLLVPGRGHRRQSGNNERFHLYSNPTHGLSSSSLNKYNNHGHQEYTMTSFIENGHHASSLENLTKEIM